MKKSYFISVLVLFIYSLNIYGQKKIYFCNDYSDAAEPISAFSEWTITPTGAVVKILYQNGMSNITSSILNLLIDRQDDNKKYQHYYSTWAMPDQTKNWAVFDYRFTEAGNYRVKVQDADNNDLATENIKIYMKEPDNSSASLDKNIDTEISMSVNYKDARVIFCERLDTLKGLPISASNEFKVISEVSGKRGRKNTTPIQLKEYILVKNGSTFNTNEITMQVYYGSYYNTFLETSKINISPDKDWFCLKYMFTKPGDYKFELFNQNNIHVATGYVKITIEKSKRTAYQ